MKNKLSMIKSIDTFFEALSVDPEKYDIYEIVVITESIIPVHATLEIMNFDEVDMLLSVYPYLYQKLVKMFAYFSHQVRIAVGNKQPNKANSMRSYRDSFEQLMKATKMQYDSLSRRITVSIERR